MSLLEVSGLSCGYGQIEVLHGVSMRVEPREVVCVIGPNGAGKTTFLRCLSGLLPVSAGAMRFDGVGLENMAPERRVRDGLVQVPDGAGVFGELSVLDNLRLTRSHSADIDTILDVFPILDGLRQQVGGSLSGGERQLLGIARALLLKPKLLMLDEPSFGLAPKIVRDVLRVVVEQARLKNAAVLLVEQNVYASLRAGDRAYLLEGGSFVMSGRSADLLNDSAIQNKYMSVEGE